MEFHSVASIFPMMSVEEFKALKESIQARGQRNPIYTYEGKIVDGRNRYQACTELGIRPRFEEWDGVGLLCDFVWDMNAGRRQLTGGALQIAAGKYAIERGKEAEKRRLANLRVGPTVSIDTVGNLKDLGDFGDSRKKAAEKFGVGEATVQRAVKVIRDAPELVHAVESGQMSINAAAALARKPVEARNKPEASNGEIKVLGVGVDRAHEAINCLRRIPKTDALRKRGFQIVSDWIKQNT